jgi:hypothetical protein
MKTEINSLSRLPRAFSQSSLTFASKTDYLAFVAEWKHTYKRLSLERRKSKLLGKLGLALRADKRIALEPQSELLAKALVALGDSAYLAGAGTSAELATWLLDLRSQAKGIARQQREAALMAASTS